MQLNCLTLLTNQVSQINNSNKKKIYLLHYLHTISIYYQSTRVEHHQNTQMLSDAPDGTKSSFFTRYESALMVSS